jgi:hypothetical protein
MLLKLHALIGFAAGSALVVTPALAQRAASEARADNRIENQIAVFAALDKVTARISKLEVPLGETVKFGALIVTPRTCYTRSPLEPPKTTSFVEVSESQLDGAKKSIFSGWMFAESPGLNAVEHPVYDVWLTDCSSPKVAAAAPVAGGRPRPGQPAAAPVPGTPSAKGAATAPPKTPAANPGQAQQQVPQPAVDPAAAEEFKRRRPPR